LQDGTTAVLLLNKGREPADVTVIWDKIGLSGWQKVRDLWERRDVGHFMHSFTARDLPRHGHMLLKIGTPGPPLPAPKPLPLNLYMVTRGGTTHLSDFFYIWRRGNVPNSDKNCNDGPITLNGTTYGKGLGCKGNSRVMYKLNGGARIFKAVVGLDDSYTGTGPGRFRVYNEDFFGNRVLFDSGKMESGASPKLIELDVTGVDCLLLLFEGKDVFGNWADAHVVAAENE